VTQAAHDHLAEWRSDFCTDGARRAFGASGSRRLAQITTVCNRLVGATGFPRRYNGVAVILDVLGTVGTCRYRLLERIQATLQRTQNKTILCCVRSTTMEQIAISHQESAVAGIFQTQTQDSFV